MSIVPGKYVIRKIGTESSGPCATAVQMGHPILGLPFKSDSEGTEIQKVRCYNFSLFFFAH